MKTAPRMMDDQFFNECIVRDECSKLESVYRAIDRWEDVAAAEWEASRPETTEMDDLQAQWAADHFNDQAYMMHVTKQSMLWEPCRHGCLLGGKLFRRFGALCEDRGIQLRDRAGWGPKRQGLEAYLGTSFRDLGGIEQVTRVCLLGNCFKHNEGKIDQEFVDECGGNVGDEIDFDAEDWPTLIYAARRFLLELVSHT